MNNPCETCAFGTGGAAQEPTNALTSMLCGLGAIPFYCHHGRDGVEFNWEDDPLGPLRLPPSNRKICAGWQEHVRTMKAHGFFENRAYIVVRRIVAHHAMALLKRTLLPNIGRGKQKLAQKEIKRCIKFLTKRDISNESIPL